MARKNRNAAGKLPPHVAQELRQARENRSSWLWLDGAELTEVPEEVFDLADLRDINLSGNRLKTIPERLWDLPKLEGVYLIGNPIESLPNRPGLTIDWPT
jgi:Leucine Rich Repeat (LRR) protein